MTRQPALALLTPSREDAGAERYLRIVARAALQRGWRVHAAFPKLVATEAMRQELAGIGVRCHPLALPLRPPTNKKDAFAHAATEARQTLAVLARATPTAVLVVLPHPDQAPGIALASALYPAASVASVQLVAPDLRFTPARRRLYRLTRAAGLRWVTLSADNRHQLATALRWPSHAIHLIHNGASPAAKPSAAQRAQLRKAIVDELGLPPDAVLILSVGRLHEQKGYDVIAASAATVSTTHPDAYWLWAGEGPQRTRLDSTLREAGLDRRVRLLGARADVPRLLAAADLFVLASRYEGFPFALLEAMAAQLPVIVSDAGPLPELVTDLVHGRVFATRDANALAAATTWALAHPQRMRTMAAAGAQRLSREFSLQEMERRTLGLLTPDRGFPHSRRGNGGRHDPR